MNLTYKVIATVNYVDTYSPEPSVILHASENQQTWVNMLNYKYTPLPGDKCTEWVNKQFDADDEGASNSVAFLRLTLYHDQKTPSPGSVADVINDYNSEDPSFRSYCVHSNGKVYLRSKENKVVDSWDELGQVFILPPKTD